MSRLVSRKTGSRLAALPCAFFLCMPMTSNADSDLDNELRRCGSIEDSSARLACYDAYNGRQNPAEKVPAAETEPELPQAPDDLGSEALPAGSGGRKVEKLAVRASVTRCQENTQNKYLFFFENGQVWKQTGGQRLNLKDCNFDVTITQDLFGYKMQTDGKKRRIRISRVK